MTFFTVVLRGLMRRPVRTCLTLVGISIGIAALVALVGISRGFEKSWETGLTVARDRRGRQQYEHCSDSKALQRFDTGSHHPAAQCFLDLRINGGANEH